MDFFGEVHTTTLVHRWVAGEFDLLPNPPAKAAATRITGFGGGPVVWGRGGVAAFGTSRWGEPFDLPGDREVIELAGASLADLWALDSEGLWHRSRTGWRLEAPDAAGFTDLVYHEGLLWLGARQSSPYTRTGEFACFDGDLHKFGHPHFFPDDDVGRLIDRTSFGMTRGGEVTQWNGRAWVEVAAYDTLPQGCADTVSLAPDGDGWCVDGKSVFHWTGEDWVAVDDPMLPAAPRFVRVFAPDDVWVADRTAVFRWDGAAWARVRLIDTVTGIWRDGSQDVWVSSYGGDLQRYDGSRWHEMSERGFTAESLVFVDGDIWMIVDTPTCVGCVKHRTEAGWRASEGSPPKVAYLIATGSDLWAATEFELHHFDGAQWTLEWRASAPIRGLAVRPDGTVAALVRGELYVRSD